MRNAQNINSNIFMLCPFFLNGSSKLLSRTISLHFWVLPNHATIPVYTGYLASLTLLPSIIQVGSVANTYNVLLLFGCVNLSVFLFIFTFLFLLRERSGKSKKNPARKQGLIYLVSY